MATDERDIRKGFSISVRTHTDEAKEQLKNPESVRFMVGHYFDSLGLQEEVDYTLEVSRIYEN